jgi:hypothetical protein
MSGEACDRLAERASELAARSHRWWRGWSLRAFADPLTRQGLEGALEERAD